MTELPRTTPSLQRYWSDQMRLPEIETQLSAVFASRLERGRKRHIVFWYDDQAEFVDDVPRLDLGDVRLLTLTGSNHYEIKRTLEVDDPTSDFLVYSPRLALYQKATGCWILSYTPSILLLIAWTSSCVSWYGQTRAQRNTREIQTVL